MNKDQSTYNLKQAIGGGETFFGKANAIVINDGSEYEYNNITVRVSYNAGYMQLDLSVIWEDDSVQVPYKQLGLHGIYNTSYQDFTFSNGCLQWTDDDNEISLTFLD